MNYWSKNAFGSRHHHVALRQTVVDIDVLQARNLIESVVVDEVKRCADGCILLTTSWRISHQVEFAIAIGLIKCTSNALHRLVFGIHEHVLDA